MKLLIVNNLTSGYQEGAIYDFVRSFAQDGDEICIRSTGGDTKIEDLITDASAYDAVVASGGDGTIATVSYALANTGIPVMPFPAGTANLLCLNMESPSEPHALANTCRDMITCDCDVIEISAGEHTLGFNIMAGAGYDAAIMKSAQSTKHLLGQMAYFTAAVQNMTPQKSHFRLVIDGQTKEADGVGVLLINFPRIQFDVPIAHDSNPCDGLMEVAIMKSENALGLLPAVGAAVLDRSGGFPDRSSALEIIQAHEVEVYAEPALKMQFDGEPMELTTPFRAHVLPQAVRYIVTESVLDKFQGQ